MLRRCVGTTLVELIVVMGLMLVIMGILLPAACKLYRAVEGLKSSH
jgi:type II secretory pathway pseudopilin PulG